MKKDGQNVSVKHYLKLASFLLLEVKAMNFDVKKQKQKKSKIRKEAKVKLMKNSEFRIEIL